MEIISVLAAAAGTWIFGAVYYGVLSKPWLEASGVPTDENGRPQNGSSPSPYVISLIGILLVAGMMRHVFSMAGIDTVAEAITAGGGIGLFFISPWIMLNNGYTMRPFKLTLIDGGYATFGCLIMGVILALL